jgi:hypothetical protein
MHAGPLEPQHEGIIAVKLGGLHSGRAKRAHSEPSFQSGARSSELPEASVEVNLGKHAHAKGARA